MLALFLNTLSESQGDLLGETHSEGPVQRDSLQRDLLGRTHLERLTPGDTRPSDPSVLKVALVSLSLSRYDVTVKVQTVVEKRSWRAGTKSQRRPGSNAAQRKKVRR